MVFSTDSQGGEVQSGGFKIGNQPEGLEEFVEAIIQCMQRADTLEYHENLIVKMWIESLRLKDGSCRTPNKRLSRTRRERKFELLSRKYEKWDWSTSEFRCFFFGAEFCRKKWFMHFNEGNSAEIQLPPNLLDDSNWLGISLCAIHLKSHEDQNIILDTPDSDSNVLGWYLEFDGALARLCTYQQSVFIQKLSPELPQADWTFYKYVPRTHIGLWRQCRKAKVTFTSSSPCLGMRSCALRLVYKDDIEDLVQSQSFCELPLLLHYLPLMDGMFHLSLSSLFFFKFVNWLVARIKCESNKESKELVSVEPNREDQNQLLLFLLFVKINS